VGRQALEGGVKGGAKSLPRRLLAAEQQGPDAFLFVMSCFLLLLCLLKKVIIDYKINKFSSLPKI